MDRTTRTHSKRRLAAAPRLTGLALALAATSAFGLGACGSARTSTPVTTPPSTSELSTPTSVPAAGSTAAGPQAGSTAARAQEDALLAQLDTARGQVDSSLGEMNGQIAQSTNTTEPDPAN